MRALIEIELRKILDAEDATFDHLDDESLMWRLIEEVSGWAAAGIPITREDRDGD